ncbi:hypothetical protein PPACK8108_LOCUS5631 [Phakopsora pachyrhizi]|uniref:Uncharacterized protein n=1 Tax=Phakopsora pachyrhizi TaxID=170000 RepID=A0AAV0AS36_PHAPC|nr:hypothetical protein PPACK8108_LOCUS5631 [Phakopsora pachyrhizi]
MRIWDECGSLVTLTPSQRVLVTVSKMANSSSGLQKQNLWRTLRRMILVLQRFEEALDLYGGRYGDLEESWLQYGKQQNFVEITESNKKTVDKGRDE